MRAGGGRQPPGQPVRRGSCSRTTTSPASAIAEAVGRARRRGRAAPSRSSATRSSRCEEAVAAGADLVLLDNMAPDEVAGCVARSGDGRAPAVEVSGGVTLETVAAYAAHRRRPHLGRRPHPLGARPRHRPRPRRGGADAPRHRRRQHPDRHRPLRRRAELRRPLAHRHQRRAHVRRARAARQPVPRPSTASRFDDDVTGVAVSLGRAPAHRRAAGDDRALPRLRRRSSSSPASRRGMPILYDNPQEVGRRPHRQRRRRLRPLRRARRSSSTSARPPPSTPSRPRASTSAAPSPRHRDQPRRAVRPGRRACAGSSWSSPAASSARRTVESIQSGVVYGFVGAGRRPVRPLRGRAGRRARWSPPAAWPGSSRRCRDAIEHHEPWLTLHGLRLIYERNQPRRERATSVSRTGSSADRTTRPTLHDASSPTLEPGDETGRTVVTVAGRLMLRRVQGKLAFGTLQDAHRPHPALRPRRRHAPASTSSPRCRSATGSASPARS